MCKKNNRALCTAATESFFNIHAMAWVSLTKVTPLTWAQYKAHNMHQIWIYSNETDNDINVDWPKHAGLKVINASKANPVLRLFRTEHFCMAVMKSLNTHWAQELKPAFNIGSVVVMIAWKSHQNEREDVHKTKFIHPYNKQSKVYVYLACCLRGRFRALNFGPNPEYPGGGFKLHLQKKWVYGFLTNLC